MSAIEKYYDIGETIGTGTFASVKIAVSKKNGKSVAIKIIDKKNLQSDGTDSSLNAEIEVLQRLNHPNIVQPQEMFETPNHVYLVMELMTGGELFDCICRRGSYSERDAASILGDILSATIYLHKKGIAHRDLKPENMLFASEDDQSVLKLTDFGLAKILDADTVMATACGTPGYVAPEVLIGNGYTPAVDMWSIGVIMYILLCGFPPFYDENIATLFQQIIEGSYSFPLPYWDAISSSAKDLVTHLLDVEPTKRYTAEQALKHPWIVGGMASSADMSDVLGKMKEYNAKRKFKMATIATIAANRMSKRPPSTVPVRKPPLAGTL